jgi:hypothetical protein
MDRLKKTFPDKGWGLGLFNIFLIYLTELSVDEDMKYRVMKRLTYQKQENRGDEICRGLI